MYSTLEDSRRADERAAAQGYEVEDWANNDLGTAVGWWTPGHDIHADDEASEASGLPLLEATEEAAEAEPPAEDELVNAIDE